VTLFTTEDPVQGLCEGVGVGAEAAVFTGEGHGLGLQLRGQRDRGAVGAKSAGFFQRR